MQLPRKCWSWVITCLRLLINLAPTTKPLPLRLTWGENISHFELIFDVLENFTSKNQEFTTRHFLKFRSNQEFQIQSRLVSKFPDIPINKSWSLGFRDFLNSFSNWMTCSPDFHAQNIFLIFKFRHFFLIKKSWSVIPKNREKEGRHELKFGR